MIRRLPVYLLVDCAGHMTGDPIASVNHGIRLLHSNLLGDPYAVEFAHLSVITFDGWARQVAPLADICDFDPPDLSAGGTRALGAALGLLIDRMAFEVRRNTPDQRGDWKPLVFLLVDGNPTDSWQSQAEQIKQNNPTPANIIAVSCGDEEAASFLKEITGNVLLLNDRSPEGFATLFKWISAVVSQASAKCFASSNAATEGMVLPPLPAGITIVP